MNFPRKLERAICLARDSIGKCGKGFMLAAVGERSDGTTVCSINGWNVKVEPKHHAEGRVVRKLDVGAVVYVARVRKNGDVAMSRPCPACQALLRSRGVRAVHYTISPERWGTIFLQDEQETVKF